MRKIAVCFILCATVFAQKQIDLPTTAAKDLADQKEAARGEATERLHVVEGAEPIMRKEVGSNPGDDPQAEAPFIQLRLMGCLIKFDYSRRISLIYSNAANAAANAAKEIDAMASTPVAPSAEAAEAQRDLNEAIRREAELRAQPSLNGVEKVELEGLPAFEKQLRDTIAFYEQIGKSRSKPSQSSDMGNRMREMEALLRVLLKETDVNTRFFKAQCESEREQLQSIAQIKREKETEEEFRRVIGGRDVSHTAGGKDGNTSSPMVAPAPSDAEKFREDERTLSDPDALKKREEYLRQISGQGGSN